MDSDGKGLVVLGRDPLSGHECCDMCGMNMAHYAAEHGTVGAIRYHIIPDVHGDGGMGYLCYGPVCDTCVRLKAPLVWEMLLVIRATGFGKE
jgi:hypothetical protein